MATVEVVGLIPIPPEPIPIINAVIGPASSPWWTIVPLQPFPYSPEQNSEPALRLRTACSSPELRARCSVAAAVVCLAPVD